MWLKNISHCKFVFRVNCWWTFQTKPFLIWTPLSSKSQDDRWWAYNHSPKLQVKSKTTRTLQMDQVSQLTDLSKSDCLFTTQLTLSLPLSFPFNNNKQTSWYFVNEINFRRRSKLEVSHTIKQPLRRVLSRFSIDNLCHDRNGPLNLFYWHTAFVMSEH